MYLKIIIFIWNNLQYIWKYIASVPDRSAGHSYNLVTTLVSDSAGHCCYYLKWYIVNEGHNCRDSYFILRFCCGVQDWFAEWWLMVIKSNSCHNSSTTATKNLSITTMTILISATNESTSALKHCCQIVTTDSIYDLCLLLWTMRYT